MNKFLYILFFVGVIILVGFVANFFLSVDEIGQEQEQTILPEVELPELNPESTTMLTKSKSGSIEVVNNITRLADNVGSDTYIFAGGLQQPDPRYVLTYYEEYDYFQVSIEDSPLDQVRLLAEDELRMKLGVGNEVLCNLNISVRTRIEVDYEMAGKELGLSFCEGSMPLREGVTIN
jgi:hypothetical protein